MSTNRLGRSENLDDYLTETLFSSDQGRIQIEDLDYRNVQGLPGVSDYPFENQKIVEGVFLFEMSGRHEGSFSREGSFQYRSASNVFLLETTTDRPRPEEVISDINQKLSEEAKIDKSLSLDRQGLWKFLQNAQSIEELVVSRKGNVFDVVDLLHQLQQAVPVDIVSEIDEKLSVSERRSLKNTLRDIDHKGNIDDIQDLNIDWHSTIISSFKARFRFHEDYADVEYKKGSFEIRGDTDLAEEYVIQLFERDVVKTK